MPIKLRILFFLPTLLLALSCSNSRSSGAEDSAGNIQLRHASLLSMRQIDGATVATITNPWDTTATLATYILIPDSLPLPDPLPQGTVLRVPLRNSLVYSAVHIGLIKELGAADAIKGVCDAPYITDSTITARIAAGTVADCGNSMSPDIERIIAMSPDAVLLSPYENNAASARIAALGTPVVQCADYMECGPLARAEWMKFFGLLYGRPAEADSLFGEVERNYLAVKALTDTVSTRPSIIFDGIYANQWHMPARSSTTATFIRDAGGTNPFDHISGTGSAAMSPEQVLLKAGDADLWLVRYASPRPMALSEFLAQQRIYPQFEAAKRGNILFCNTIITPVFEETPFHPDLYLTHLAALLHPELNLCPRKSYFSAP